MLFDSPVPTWALVILCVVPGAARLLSGRALVALIEDPVLPERLLAHRRRGMTILWLVLVSLMVFGGFGSLFWAAPILVLTRAAAGYPLRRALFNERWSL